MTSRIEQACELLRAELHELGRSPQHLHGDLIALRDLVVAANTLAVWKANLPAKAASADDDQTGLHVACAVSDLDRVRQSLHHAANSLEDAINAVSHLRFPG